MKSSSMSWIVAQLWGYKLVTELVVHRRSITLNCYGECKNRYLPWRCYQGIVTQILNLIAKVNFGEHFIEIGLLMRETTLINEILFDY